MTAERVRQGVFAAVLVLSLVILFAPGNEVPPAPPGVDKVVHLVLFAALACTAVLAGLGRSSAIGLLLLLYAAGSEVLQAIPVLDRSASVLDWVADAAGVLVGIALTIAVRRRRTWRTSPR